MIIISSFATKQIQSLEEKYGPYKTKGEVGRSAFWIWYDKVLNETRTVNVKQARRIGNGTYRYHMEYWGDILFKTIMVRNRGRFAGYNILITGFNFNIDNFRRWLQHDELIEPPVIKPNIPRKPIAPRNIKMGYTKVRSNSGLWAVADANGQPISNYWFKDITNMRRTRTGEIATIVNKDGWAFAYFPNRDSAHCLVNMKKPYETVITEAAFNKVFNEEFNRAFGETMLNESTDNIDVKTVLNSGILKEFINAITYRYFMIMEAKKDTEYKRTTKKLDEVDKCKHDESLEKKIKNVVRDTIGDMMRQSYKVSYPELYADIQSGKRTNRGNGKYKDNLYFGWNMVEWNYKQTNTDKDTLEALHKSYDRYGEDCVKKGEEPCEAGFNAWCLERMSDFPNYY